MVKLVKLNVLTGLKIEIKTIFFLCFLFDFFKYFFYKNCYKPFIVATLQEIMINKKCKYHCYKNTRKFENINKTDVKNIELVVFDMDGVLADIYSSWKFIHDFFETNNDESVNEYLKGNIDDLEFIRRDVCLWKINGEMININILYDILSDVPIMKGAKDCIRNLKKLGFKTAIVSARLCS